VNENNEWRGKDFSYLVNPNGVELEGQIVENNKAAKSNRQRKNS
jgi:hypothetical protein